MSNTATEDYFGKETVEKAIRDYFAKHGTTKEVRDELIEMVHNQDDFFQMVCDYIEK